MHNDNIHHHMHIIWPLYNFIQRTFISINICYRIVTTTSVCLPELKAITKLIIIKPIPV